MTVRATCRRAASRPGGARAEPPPRVLHVAQPTDGGVRRYVVAVCADQLARGWQVSVACPTGPLVADLDALNVTWWPWPATRSPGPSSISETLHLLCIIRAVAPDVVHLHSSKAGLAGRLAVRGHCPTIFQPHCWSWLAVTGPLRWVTLRWERLACRWSTVVVCVGDGEASAGHAAGLHAPVRIVRNGVDRTRLRPAGDDEKRRARHDLGVPSDAPLVICAGRLTRQKGQDVLLEAWPAVRRRCPNAHLVLIGDGAVALQPRVAPTGARFEPAVHDIRPWLAAADIVAVPSRWEGLPLIALEAVATGRPVVGSAVGGLTEVVTARVGCLVEPDDPVALADALAARLTDPVLAAEEGRHAVALAARFDQRRTLDLLAELTLTAAWERPI